MKLKFPERHICSVAVVCATVAMLAAMLIPLFFHSADSYQADYNGNGLSDAADFVIGARKDAESHPVYDASYVAGYPPETVGVCTDLIWRAFREAGYSLRDMVDADIASNPAAYPNITKRDRNIDYRRVVNLHIFFKRYAISLTTDPSDPEAWEPGDIVIFRNDRHIGMISDRKNASGVPLVLHNGGQEEREEDYLNSSPITAHFRFDARLIPEEILRPWTDE